MDGKTRMRNGWTGREQQWEEGKEAMDGRMHSKVAQEKADRTAQEIPVPTSLYPVPALDSPSSRKGRWLTCPHLWVGLGDQQG